MFTHTRRYRAAHHSNPAVNEVPVVSGVCLRLSGIDEDEVNDPDVDPAERFQSLLRGPEDL